MERVNKDKLAEQLRTNKETQRILDIGSSHPHSCDCEICKKWWELMGKDSDNDS